jgi:predicted nucleic acid-binding protein
MKGLIDSNVMIYLAKGLVDVGDLIQRYDEMLISRITHMEVLVPPEQIL